MGADITKSFPKAKVDIKPGGKGDFIVTVDGKQIWNKRQMNDEFPEPAQILGKMKK